MQLRPRVIPKWGFGMAPLKAATELQYRAAALEAEAWLSGMRRFSDLNREEWSVFKGLLNRCARQDQWDWFTVYAMLGEPNPRQLWSAERVLGELRVALKNSSEDEAEEFRKRLIALQVLTACRTFLGLRQPLKPEPPAGAVYILSTREFPNMLKVGMTTRSVAERVREINGATGVLIPFGCRAVFRVKDAARAERELFSTLAEHRVRQDREFFELSFYEAKANVAKYLWREALLHRLSGAIQWCSSEKRHGAILGDDAVEYFFRFDDCFPGFQPVVGRTVEFDPLDRANGPCAKSVTSARSV